MNSNGNTKQSQPMTLAQRERIWPSKFVWGNTGKECPECFAFGGHTDRCVKTQ